jgi:ferredoxin
MQQAGTLGQQLKGLDTHINRIETKKTPHTVAILDPARCTGCGRCVSVCPQLAIALVENGAEIDADRCTGCGACIQECPRQAITLKAA